MDFSGSGSGPENPLAQALALGMAPKVGMALTPSQDKYFLGGGMDDRDRPLTLEKEFRLNGARKYSSKAVELGLDRDISIMRLTDCSCVLHPLPGYSPTHAVEHFRWANQPL